MTPLQFEDRCADIMRGHGWKCSTTPKSGDQGIDVLGEKAGVRVVLQCKLYAKPVGNRAVQEAFAGRIHAGANYAAVVTTASFTPSARALAQSTGVALLHIHDLAAAAGRWAPTPPIRQCQACRALLRLPPGRSGFVRCPKCGDRFYTHT